ncbi:hypothetical protein P9112_005625 [Eukaryota sp. TZLM1-RC]
MGKKAGSKKKSPQEHTTAPSTKTKQGGTHIYVRHILCEKQSKILEAQSQLNAGTQFDQVARDFSEDKARQGGLLGWKTRQDLHGSFSNVAFDLPTGTPSPVFKTPFGYHICLVEKRK